MRRTNTRIALGVVVTFVTVLLVLRLANRDDRPDSTLPVSQNQTAQPVTDEPILLCDFRLDPEEGLEGHWELASQPCSLESGWGRPARRGLSSSSHRSTMDVYLERTDWSQFIMRIKGDTESNIPLGVEVRFNDLPLGTAEIPSGWKNIALSIPPGLLRQEGNQLTFSLVEMKPAIDEDRERKQPRHAFLIRQMALATPRGSTPLAGRTLRQLMDDRKAEPAPTPQQDIERAALRSSSSAVDNPSIKNLGNDRPDIVLITLDAARPDHFSCYGYHRETTPNIDRLARESLVFTNVFALVPNTRQSVPTIVTGLSFLNHGVTNNNLMLADEATTLAEHLKGAGYRTTCFSATPNNSRSLGTDQGYDDFFELWTEATKTESMDPHFLASRAIKWLETNEASTPLHLQLHFVPPHAPYLPAPEFDLFTESEYGGVFDGFPHSILWSTKDRREPSASDLAHVIASYDGNLRAADDAVAKILDYLKSRPNWNRTIVLVTSDHGEAFFEHGHVGHNRTVYDEMLRVPFILRIPEGVGTAGIDTGRLASLADLVPTLLAASSVQPEARFDGIDLLSVPALTEGPEWRSFEMKTTHQRPTRGFRSSRWKVIVSNSGRGELYDLENDPRELFNLNTVDRPTFLEQGLLLVQRFASAPMSPTLSREIKIPDRDREMLEALGYVD